MTRKQVSKWHQQALDVAQHVARLETEVARLSAENASLRGQIKQIEQAGGATLSVTVAEQIGEALKAQPMWSRITLGKGGIAHWNTEHACPMGGGLLGLRDDLMAIPGDDVILGIGWDSRERSRAKRTGNAPRPRPARFFNYDTVGTTLRFKRNDAVSADALEALTKGLRNRTLKATLEVAFLLWGDLAIKCLRDDPEVAVATIANEIERSYAKASELFAKRFAEMFSGLLGQPDQSEMVRQAKATLGIPENATAEDIKRAWRDKARQHHPDAGGDAATFNAISEAYKLLTA